MGIQALLSDASIEAFDFGVIGWPAWPAEVQFDPMLIGPFVHGLRDELATIVDLDCGRQSAMRDDPIERGDHVLALQALPHVDGQTLARVVVDHG